MSGGVLALWWFVTVCASPFSIVQQGPFEEAKCKDDREYVATWHFVHRHDEHTCIVSPCLEGPIALGQQTKEQP